jgi:hypothetical protein
MKKIFISVFIAFSGMLIASAQSFEGVIEFKKVASTDTVNYIYYIKGDKVRLDEIGSKSKKAEGSFIIDLKANSMIALNIERKLYSEQSSGAPVTIARKADVKKTGNVKTIQGMKCSEYIVKNTDEKVQVTYWMASNNFDFFFKLLKVLNRKDKSAVYVQQITGAEGMFPFLSSQVNLETNKEEVKMEVTKIEKKAVDASKFDIPKDYQKFQK